MKGFAGQQWPYKWELVHTIETDRPQSLEQRLHRLYRKHRVNGEWFDLPADVVQELLSYKTEGDVPRLRGASEDRIGQKRKYTISLEESAWAALEEIARQRNFVYRGRLNPSAAIGALIGAYLKKRAKRGNIPPEEASARDEVKQPAKPWTIAAVLAHWPEKDRERYKLDEHKHRLVVQHILDTINEQSP